MPDRHRPRVSVVIPFQDRAQFLDDAVTSCLEAYSGPLEMVLVDDGSIDPRTAGAVAALAVPERADLKIIRQENAGPARARNRGLQHCSGEFVQFLDSDDLLARNKIEHQLRHLALNPGADASVSDYWVCDESRFSFDAPPSSIAPFALGIEDFLFRWERGFTIPIHSPLFRRRIVCDAPPWPDLEGSHVKDDWLFWVHLALRGARLAYLPLRLCVYRLHGANMTRAWATMGLQWLKAAGEVERWLGGRYPDFMDSAMKWYVEFYVDRAEREPSHAATPRPAPPIPPTLPRRPTLPRTRRPLDARLREVAASTSVVVPVFNHARHLRKCILSVRDQTVPPGEIVCVDDASTDSSVRGILEDLASEVPHLRLRFLDRNRGIANVQNLAVADAAGVFVAFLDCDDFLPPDAIETIAGEVAEHPDVDYVFTDRYEVDLDGRLLREAVYGGYPEPNDLDRVSHYENLLDAMIASHLKVVRRAKILEVGGFDPRTSGVQDWDLALKIAEVGKLHYVPRSLYYHRVHWDSVTLGRRVEMFRLTNEVRRRHQAVRARKGPALQPGLVALESVAAFVAHVDRPGGDASRADVHWDREMEAWSDAAGVAIVATERPSSAAFRLWSRTPATVFVLQRGAPAATLAFLREFNSYFDLIVCADEGQWLALHRYVWDARVLRLRDEVGASVALEVDADAKALRPPPGPRVISESV